MLEYSIKLSLTGVVCFIAGLSATFDWPQMMGKSTLSQDGEMMRGLHDTWKRVQVVKTMFMSAALRFCRNEARDGTIEIISIGSGDGVYENEIIEAYHHRFAKNITITLVDNNTLCKADYRTVDELLQKRPQVVGRCALLIMWPEPATDDNEYDIDAIRKLRPCAVLTEYEITGLSGSFAFEEFLHDDSLRFISPSKYGMKDWMQSTQEDRKIRDPDNYGVADNYSMEEVYLGNEFPDSVSRTVILRRLD